MNRRTALLTLGGIGAVALAPDTPSAGPHVTGAGFCGDEIRGKYVPSDEEFADISKFIGVWWEDSVRGALLVPERAEQYEQEMRATLVRELVAQDVVVLDHRPAYLGVLLQGESKTRIDLVTSPKRLLNGPAAMTVHRLLTRNQKPVGMWWGFHRTGAPYDPYAHRRAQARALTNWYCV